MEKVDPESYLLHCMEIQRRKRFDGRHVVGGLAHLTTITASGLTQPDMQRRPSACVGAPIFHSTELYAALSGRRYSHEVLARHEAESSEG
ncbi:hypothetical protein ABID65_009620 [Bradyrhizobium sp. S3.9.2]|uniref:hypothetical protein n=1 Tax=Bradyrhizobium sp. S3.9.2 TaxID=3156432 RepID=UPI00339B0BD1